VQHIRIEQIVEDTEQPRKHYNEESLKGLADSIRQHGMLNPITITPLNGGDTFRIVTGARRWRAASLARLDTIPCIIVRINDEERLTLQLIENLQREDLQPIEKAKALQHVKSALNLTNREVARRLGLSERTVGYLLDLLDLPQNIGEAVIASPNRPADGQLTEKHARFLKQLNDTPELQSAVVDRIKGEKLSSEDTSNLVKALRKQPEKSKEILESPTDHLVRFFQDAPLPPERTEETPEPVRISSHAQRILDFLPVLKDIQIARVGLPELRQIADALTSLQLVTEGLLRDCKSKLGE
jgi:ParB family chromosome partitioning protein